MKVSIILGTRPEIIKMSPVIKELEKRSIDYSILHTGQHYDFMMDKVFFGDLNLNPEATNLDLGSGTHAETTGKIIIGTEKILAKSKPDIVLVQGDTNSVLAGSLVSVKLHIPLGHVEAGLRSYDRRMPEEYNRVIADHVSDWLFAPTKRATKTLHAEGIGSNKILFFDKVTTPKIFLTGNTIVDAINQNLKRAKNNSQILQDLGISGKDYFLMTLHREENVDYKDKLLGILKGIEKLSIIHNKPIIYPVHPRTKKRLIEFGLEKYASKIENLKMTNPVGFLDFLTLESNAELILTDSGGIQEEACTLGVPCVVLRDRSDRPESIEVGASRLSGCNPKAIEKASKHMLNKASKWKNPFGDGKAAERIVKAIA